MTEYGEGGGATAEDAGARSANSAPSGLILAIDPGRQKCGFALLLVDTRPARSSPARVVEDFELIRRGAVPTDALEELYRGCELDCPGGQLRVLVGDGTGSREVVAALKRSGADCLVCPEQFTTARARRRYFVEYPPTGWSRLIPTFLLTPPRPVDDLAAQIIAEDWLAHGSALSFHGSALSPQETPYSDDGPSGQGGTAARRP